MSIPNLILLPSSGFGSTGIVCHGKAARTRPVVRVCHLLYEPLTAMLDVCAFDSNDANLRLRIENKCKTRRRNLRSIHFQKVLNDRERDHRRPLVYNTDETDLPCTIRISARAIAG